MTFLRKSAPCALGTPRYACVPGHCSLGLFTASWSGTWKITERAVPQFLCIHGGSGISSFLDLTLFWMEEMRRKLFFSIYQGNRVSSLLHAATAEFISEIMLWPVRRGWWPDQAWEMSQCGIVHPMLLYSVIYHPSVELAVSWGGVQREGVKGQAKIFWLLLGLPCCESCELRFCVNPVLLKPTQSVRNYLPQPASQVVLHWDSSSWGAAGMTTKKQQYTMTQQGKQ